MLLRDVITKGLSKKKWEERMMGEAHRREEQKEEVEALIKKLTEESLISSNNKCGTCKFWEEDTGQRGGEVEVRLGLCHRYPPTPFLLVIPSPIQGGPPSTATQNQYPAIKIFGWCGEWLDIKGGKL